jgi:hypothetical protein
MQPARRPSVSSHSSLNSGTQRPSEPPRDP